MKRRSFYVTSILGFLVATTLAFQNCNNKKFNTTSGANVKGTLGSMDSSGVIEGEVIFGNCDEEDEIKSGKCPESAIIKFYAVEENDSKTYIDSTEANLTEYIKNGVKAYKYVFSFVVPSQHVCKDIEVYAVDPVTKSEILITPDSSFIMWGGDTTRCEVFEPVDPTPTGTFDIEGVNQDGRLVEVYGKCKGTTDVLASGDLNDIINKTESCASAKFRHCDLLSKYSATNHVVVKQGSIEDSVDLMGPSPTLVFTFDSFTKSTSNNKQITVTGKCTPGADITLTIYNSVAASFTCPDNGQYSKTGNYLVAGLSNRVMFGKLENRFGKVEINADVDSENATLSCGISQTIARTDFCTKQAATLKGTCVNGLPVHVLVNGNQQTIAYCSSGTFEVKNVLLQKVGDSNVVKIEQRNPYGRTCSGTKTVTQF